MSAPSEPAGRPDRPVGVVHATALVVANMVGAGIFTTSGLLAETLASPAWILGVWLAGGVLALAGADVYAELGAMMPRAGGEYVYLRRAFHPLVGFLSGWTSLFVGFSAPIAASAIAFGEYLAAVAPAVPPDGAAVALVLITTGLHMASVTWGSRVQTGFTALKVLLLLGFVLGGVLAGTGDLENLASGEGAPTPGALGVSLVFVAFAYSGWNAAAYVAGEIEDPGRTLPRALLGGTALVTVLYLALNAVFFYAAPAEALAGKVEVGHAVARSLFGAEAGDIFSTLIALALMSSVSAMVMAGPRVYLAMAEDGLFFRALTRRGRSGAPWAAVALQGALAVALVLSAAFDALLVYIGFTLSLFGALTVLAAFMLRRQAPREPRPYRARAWPISPVAFLALSGWMVMWSVAERPVESLAGVATLGAGALIYLAWVKRRGRAGG